MNMKDSLESWKLRLKSVPKTFVAYKKNNVNALDNAKKERKFFAPIIFMLLMFLSCAFFIGSFLRGVDYDMASSRSMLNNAGLLKYVQTFSVRVSFVLGFVLFFVMFFVYVLTRFACVKLFSRKAKAGAVFADSIIGFGLNSIPLIVFFVAGGILASFVWWTFYPLAVFVFLFFIVMLNRSVFDAVDREKQTSLLTFTIAVFMLLALALILAFVLLVAVFVIVTIARGVNSNIQRILNNINDAFSGFWSFFGRIGDWFRGLFS